MFYLTTTNVHTIPSLQIPSQTYVGDNSSIDTPLYRMNVPYRLMLVTTHPQDDEHFFTVTSIDPENSVYSTLKKEDIVSILPKSLHQHDYYELMYVLDGELFQNIENQRHYYLSGSCCLLNKNVRHREEYSTDYRAIFLEISEELLFYIYNLFSISYFKQDCLQLPTQLDAFFKKNRDAFDSNAKDYIDFIPLYSQQWQIEHVHQIFDSLIHETLNPNVGSTFAVHSQLFQLLLTLADTTAYTTTPVSIGTSLENQLFDQITNIQLSNNGHISRKQLEKETNYSATYLNTITKKYTGLSLLEYGMTFCMKEAIHLLKDTDKNISDIAFELGFSNRTQFYKKFQEYYHVTPAKYRKEHQ